MTPMERVDRALKGASWEEAEEAGIEVLARCTALHIYAREKEGKYVLDLAEKICKRADEWAHEEKNTFLLYMARMAFLRIKRENQQDNTKNQLLLTN